ncbi:unnamed protein product [Blepharisma stoltei]|uniref:BRCT domain-containing protein n=1 Tax=Blepharisma stoltei TaxID=1481888 RepID=A0AAU9KEB3_9CILI|nr:unnamed protein product [Blepharisma stoltei]
MRRVINYQISQVNFPEISIEPIENIKSVNRNTHWEINSQEGTVDLEFPETTIGEIDIGAMSSIKLKIVGWLHTQKDSTLFFQKSIKRKESLNAIVYRIEKDFPTAQNKTFTSLRLFIENKEKKQGIMMNYFIVKTEVIDETTNSIGLKKSFCESKEQEMKSAQKNHNGHNGKKLNKEILGGISDFFGPEHLAIKSNKIFQPPALDWSKPSQTALINPPQVRDPPPSPKREASVKIPTQSYSNILEGCIISCNIVNLAQKRVIEELVEAMGGYFIQENKDAAQYIISDGTTYSNLLEDLNNGVTIVAPQWIFDCITNRRKMEPSAYLLFN